MTKKVKKARGSNPVKKNNWKLFSCMAGAVLLIIVLTAVLFYPSGKDNSSGTEKKTYGQIELYMDENYSDPDNLKEVHVASIFYQNGTFRLEILESDISKYYNPEMSSLIKKEIQKSFDEIRVKDNLTITYENMENGALVMYAREIPKTDELYIYAIEEAISGMFTTKLK